MKTNDYNQPYTQGDRLVHWGDESGVVVLIDAENTTYRMIGFIQSQAEQLGPLRIQYVFGNWFNPTLCGWEMLLESYRLEMRHHEPVASGKNATDIHLVTCAMRLYYQGYRIFCIVASDSDYTPTLEFLCEQGCLVMIIGKAKTPLALRSACSVFVDLPISYTKHGQGPVQKKKGCHVAPPDLVTQPDVNTTQEHISLWVLAQLQSFAPSPDAWILVPTFRDYLKNKYNFRPNDYNYKHLFALLQAFPDLFLLRPLQGNTNVHEVRKT